jgi:polar amino acid transport system substrate-binding protein
VLRFLLVLVLALSCNFRAHKKKTSFTVARSVMWERALLYGLEKNLSGFVDDLLDEVAKLENIKIRVVVQNQFSLVSFLERQEVDGILSLFEPDPSQKEQFRFSDPFFIFGPVLVVRTDSPYKSLQDMKDKQVGIERNFFPAISINESARCIFEPFDDPKVAVEALLNKQVDGVIIDAAIAYKLYSGANRNKIRIAGPPLRPLAFRLITLKGQNEELVDYFNHALATMKSTGNYYKILSYWGLFDITNPDMTIRPQAQGY